MIHPTAAHPQPTTPIPNERESTLPEQSKLSPNHSKGETAKGRNGQAWARTGRGREANAPEAERAERPETGGDEEERKEGEGRRRGGTRRRREG